MQVATATCIGLSAVRLLKQDANAVMVVLPSDHYIQGEKNYIDTLSQAIEMANRRRCIVTLGIEPNRPETGYGYIEMGERTNGNISTYKIARFTENAVFPSSGTELVTKSVLNSSSSICY